MPEYAGFVFAPSRLQIDERTAASFKERLNPQIKVVGVFVNEKVDVIAKLHCRGIIDLAQLHGDEDGGYITLLKKLCGCTVIKSIGVGNGLPSLPHEPDFLLFDTLSQQRGATGQTFDWTVLENVCDRPYFLAGGLTPNNVSDAIALLSPFCVDVSSGVETNGYKDISKIHEFVRLAKTCP